MKKLLSLVMIVVFALSMVACDDGEAMATETMDGFMKAVVSLDGDAMASYLDDPEAVPEEIKNLNIDSIMETVPAELGAYKENLSELLDAMIKKMSSVMNYKIENVASDGDGFVYTIAVTDVGDTDVISSAFSEDVMSDIINTLVEDGKITETTTENQLMDMIFDEVIAMVDKIEIETTTTDKQFYVYEKDSKWVVDAEKSNIE